MFTNILVEIGASFVIPMLFVFGVADLILLYFVFRNQQLKESLSITFAVTIIVSILLLAISSLMFKMEFLSGTPLWNMYGWPSHFMEYYKDTLSNIPEFTFMSFRLLSFLADFLFFLLITYPIVQTVTIFNKIGNNLKALLVGLIVVMFVVVIGVEYNSFVHDSRVCGNYCVGIDRVK
jgi:hypothetical protein